MTDRGPPPRVSVIVTVRDVPATLDDALESLAGQRSFQDIEVIVADGSPQGVEERLRARYPWVRLMRSARSSLPGLKGEAMAVARGEFVAILDPTDAAEPDWVDEILAGMADPTTTAVGGTVTLHGPATAANRAAYLFEYGAFNPPVREGVTDGDLPGNNVAYRRAVLVESCGDLLRTEGFFKPLFHQRIRELTGRLVVRAGMRVRHLTRHRFLAFGNRRFHYGRCFGAVRWRRSPARLRVLFIVFAPAVPVVLMVRHLVRAARHPANRRLLPHAGLALLGVCLCWGVGEWLGYWFGAGRSCETVY